MQPNGPSICGQTCFKPPSLAYLGYLGIPEECEADGHNGILGGTCQIAYHHMVKPPKMPYLSSIF